MRYSFDNIATFLQVMETGSISAAASSLMQNALIHGVMGYIEDETGDTDARPG